MLNAMLDNPNLIHSPLGVGGELNFPIHADL